MNKKIKTKIAEIVSALGAKPAIGISGIIPGNFIANGVQYSFNVIKLQQVYPSVKEEGYMFSIKINEEHIIECGFYLPTEDIVKLLIL